MTITRVNKFRSARGKSEDARALLESVVEYVASSAGCNDCELLRDTSDADVFLVIERWESTAAHQASLANYPKDQMQAAMSLFAGPPEGAYYSPVEAAE